MPLVSTRHFRSDRTYRWQKVMACNNAKLRNDKRELICVKQSKILMDYTRNENTKSRVDSGHANQCHQCHQADLKAAPALGSWNCAAVDRWWEAWLSNCSLPPACLSWKYSDQLAYCLQSIIIFQLQHRLLSAAAWNQCCHPTCISRCQCHQDNPSQILSPKWPILCRVGR